MFAGNISKAIRFPAKRNSPMDEDDEDKTKIEDDENKRKENWLLLN
jgi:hypothetical protein